MKTNGAEQQARLRRVRGAAALGSKNGVRPAHNTCTSTAGTLLQVVGCMHGPHTRWLQPTHRNGTRRFHCLQPAAARHAGDVADHPAGFLLQAVVVGLRDGDKGREVCVCVSDTRARSPHVEPQACLAARRTPHSSCRPQIPLLHVAWRSFPRGAEAAPWCATPCRAAAQHSAAHPCAHHQRFQRRRCVEAQQLVCRVGAAPCGQVAQAAQQGDEQRAAVLLLAQHLE